MNFLVSIIDIFFVPRSINVIDYVLFDSTSDGIVLLPSDYITTSPNNLNPAGCTVSIIKSLQIEIGDFDLITYE